MSVSPPAEDDGWQTIEVLKRDLFGRIERGCHGPDGTPIIRRVPRAAPWPTRPIAYFFAMREAKALKRLDGLTGVPRLLRWKGGILERSYIAGVTLKVGEAADREFYRKALALLHRIHRSGVAHNDLAKRVNWLVTEDGDPAIIDFQLARCVRRRGFAFKNMAREDLRHLLKHKRLFCPQFLTPKERQVVSRKSPFSHIWMAIYQKPYRLVTRRILGWADQEGRGLTG